MKFLDRLLGRKPQLEPKPITVNPSNPAQLKRHVGRLVTLYAALARDANRLDVRHEITQRKAAIEMFGHPAPINEADARALLALMEG